MKYIGGKWRQAKHIVAAVRSAPDFDVYIEPFCGAMWSACAAVKAFPRKSFVLSDVNPYLMSVWTAALDGWNPPAKVTEKDYWHYYNNRNAKDPMCGYVGFAASFAGKFFGGYVKERSGNHTTMLKIKTLRQADVRLSVGDYSKIKVPTKSVVYLDPPYDDRTKQSRDNADFDRDAYYEYAAKLSKRSYVLASEFINPKNWQVVHDFGDTVIRHHNAKPPDGTRELLMRVS